MHNKYKILTGLLLAVSLILPLHASKSRELLGLEKHSVAAPLQVVVKPAAAPNNAKEKADFIAMANRFDGQAVITLNLIYIFPEMSAQEKAVIEAQSDALADAAAELRVFAAQLP